METPSIHPITNQPVSSHKTSASLPSNAARIILVFLFVLGALTGYVLATFTPRSGTVARSTEETKLIKTETSAGVLDKKTFTDTATGTLREGGFEGEGSHHLERGGKDQTAYITSSTIDLSPFVGKKVTVWGKTYQSVKAGWLMDVGYVELAK